VSAADLLAAALITHHPAEAARVMERFTAADAAPVIAELPAERAGALLHWMAPAFAADCVVILPDEAAAAALAELDANAAAAVMRRLPDARRDSLLGALPRRDRTAIATLLASPPGTAGAVMDPGALGLPDDLTVADALAELRRDPPRFARYLYILARGDRRLVGVLSMWELLAAAPETRLSAIMHPHVVHIPASAPLEALVEHPGWTDWYALPVVDAGGALIGAIGHEVAIRLQRGRRAPDAQSGTELAMHLAELFWLGLAGVTRGLATESARRGEPGAALQALEPEPAPPAEEP
jgi:magnesium transporter